MPGSEVQPLLRAGPQKPRGIFVMGRRIRMNIVPMILNIFVPWGIFLFASMVAGGKLRYTNPWLCWVIIAGLVALWIGACAVALWARKDEPDPTWFTYAALMVGIAILLGVLFGEHNYDSYYRKQFEVQDLKVISQIDASRENGQSIMDGGLFYFAEGNILDPKLGWHFKHGTVYCIAPVVMKGKVPETGSYDFWAVGKDCCSTSSSDFRCGSFDDPNARSGLRITDDKARPFYRLAVEQAASLYNIKATYPIFLEWEKDPLTLVNSWQKTGFRRVMMANFTFFVFSVIVMAFAVFKFSFMGRSLPAVKAAPAPTAHNLEEAAWEDNAS